jgi:hypothetical protein
MKRKFPQCAPANMETGCLLEIGDFSRKLRLRCSCQFPWCSPAVTFAALLIETAWLPLDMHVVSFQNGHNKLSWDVLFKSDVILRVLVFCMIIHLGVRVWRTDFCLACAEKYLFQNSGKIVIVPVPSLRMTAVSQTKSNWGTLVPRIKVENGVKLGFLLE